MPRIKARSELKDWDEGPYGPPRGPKLTKAVITKIFDGDLTGEGVSDCLMCYADDENANYVSLERITGSIGERSGGFVIQHVGVFAQGVAKSKLLIVPGSGTGDFVGITGKGSFAAKTGPIGTTTLDYEI